MSLNNLSILRTVLRLIKKNTIMYTEARLLLRLSTGVKISDRFLNAFIEMLDTVVVAMSGFVAVSKAFLSFFSPATNTASLSCTRIHAHTRSLAELRSIAPQLSP